MNEKDIVCLTETQQKVDKVEFNRNITKHDSMRTLKDKKRRRVNGTLQKG